MTSGLGRPVGPRRDRGALVWRGIGEVLVTLGVLVLLFCVYALYGTGQVTSREQSRLAEELDRIWSGASVSGRTPSPTAREPPPGRALARLYLPRLSGSEPLVVVEGVGVPDLKKGPGHLPGSALPGEVGNLVISGHRTTYGAPFREIDELDGGDALVVETRDRWLTYRVTTAAVVPPTAVEVTFPVPGERDATPSRRLITLTTCHPEFSARQRLVVTGELESVAPSTAGPPTALREG